MSVFVEVIKQEAYLVLAGTEPSWELGARRGHRGSHAKKLDLGLTLNCFVRGYLDIVEVVTSRHFDTDFVDCAVTLWVLQWSFIEQRIHLHKNIEQREQSRQLLYLSSCFDIIHNLESDYFKSPDA